ncbi:MAG: tol-pal system protein YbgF [Rhodobiaceae bacterium]|nr:tol-pal system protein YbgF [Rhodobiaceae bacterium]MCC0041002.1 tol-pal system protein YbgF [Rhodobiaceae bacterium]
MIQPRLLGVAALAVTVSLSAPQVLAQQAGDPGLGVRLNGIEEQLRYLTGEVERLTHQVRELERAAGAPAAQGAVQPRAPQPAAQAPAPSSVATATGGQPALGAPPQNLGQLRLDDQGKPLDITGLSQALPAGTPGSGTLVPMAAAPTGPSPRDVYDEAYGYILRGDYAQAESGFRTFLAQYPGDELVPNAKFWIGESFFQRGDYQNAARTFLDTSQAHPDAAKAPESMLKLGLSLAALQQRDPACSTLNELMRRYPRAEPSVLDQAQVERRTLGC